MVHETMTASARPDDSNEPYCSNCGYKLTGLTESSRCPECGKPLVEVLSRRHVMLESGKRWRSKATFMGLPVIDIALGPKHGELRGKARGFIAIGDIATGWLAIGGIARGLVAFGGVSLGGLTLGGMSVGVIAAMGGGAIGGLGAVGGGAAGALAVGGGAVGYIAQGGGVLGYFARGGNALGVHTISRATGSVSPQAQRVFDQWSWFFGPWPPSPIGAWQPLLPIGLLVLAVVCVLGLIAALAMRRDSSPSETFRMER